MRAGTESSRRADADPAREPGPLDAPPRLLPDARPRLLLAALVGVLLLGALVRVHYSAGPGTVIDRQYRSYLIARAFYFSWSEELPEWRKRVAATSADRQESLEPRVTELVAAAAYRALGRESLRVARLVPAAFWMLGALPLFLLARRFVGPDGALLATLYYVLTPFGVLMSVSLLPEALMITMLLVSLLLVVRYHEHPSGRRLAVAIVVSALAVVIKPFVVFALLGAFAALAACRDRSFAGERLVATVLYGGLAVLPAAVYYGYGLLLADYLRWKVDSSFLPHLLWSREFWEGWLRMGLAAAGVSTTALGLLGVALLPRGRHRALLAGLFGGYVAFCLLFNYFTRFLEYYHAQLIVIVALALAPLAGPLTQALRPAWVRPWGRPLMVGSLALVVAGSALAVRDLEPRPRFEERRVAQEIGEIVGHSDRVAYIAHVYGLPLEYYGELAGEAWPRSRVGWPLAAGPEQPRGIDERLPMLGFVPRYFVITNLQEYERYHADLRGFLAAFARPVAERDDFLVYEMTEEWQAIMQGLDRGR